MKNKTKEELINLVEELQNKVEELKEYVENDKLFDEEKENDRDMLNIKDIDNLINVLTEVKKEQESKQLDMLQEKIKQELINELKRTLINFQSNTMEKFLEDSDKHICFDYNFDVIMNAIKDKLVVEVWEVA